MCNSSSNVELIFDRSSAHVYISPNFRLMYIFRLMLGSLALIQLVCEALPTNVRPSYSAHFGMS